MTESLAQRALEAHLAYYEWAKVPERLNDAYLIFLAMSGRSQGDATGQDPEEAIRRLGYTPEALGYYARSELELLNEAPTVAVSADMLDVSMSNGGIWWKNHPEGAALEGVAIRMPDAAERTEYQDLYSLAGDPDWGTLGFEADQEHLPVLTKEMLPWLEKPGFLWFEKPVPYPDFDINMLTEFGASALPTIGVKAMGWKLVPEVTVRPGLSVPGVAIFLWCEHPVTHNLTLLDFTGWAFGYEFEVDTNWKATIGAADTLTANDGLVNEQTGNAMVNPHVAMTRLLLLSIWGIMTRSIDRVRPPRAVRRRAERSGLGSFAEYGDVQVINLSRFLDQTSRHRKDYDPETDGVEWSCRWIVSGHWAWRHCSQENADEGEIERKRVYIYPYQKGPEDKPLVIREKVYAVVRAPKEGL